MRKFLLFLMVATISLFSFTVSKAEGKLYVGYCDGQIATATSGKIVGQTGNNATIGELIRIPGSMLAGYKGLKLTGVHAGLATASAYPEALTGWISTSQDGERIATGTLSAPVAGWNDIVFETAYTITGEEAELWIGFEFVQSKKLNVISFAGNTSEDGCWIGKNGKYTDFSSRDFGSLAVEGALEGDIPERDLVIESASTVYSKFQMGDPIKLNVQISNQANTVATNPIIEVSLDGNPVYTYTYNGSLNYRDKATVKFEVPSESVTEDVEMKNVKIDFNLKWADGSVDDIESNNSYSLVTELHKLLYLRAMVVEEGTGAWCGYCVRGLVGMKHMRETYPDTFVGIGVHNGDQYVISQYDSWMGGLIEGYPEGVANRAVILDPSAEEMEYYMSIMDPFAREKLTLKAMVPEDNKIKFTADIQFLNDIQNAAYNIAFVVLEDKMPIQQTNYYSGGSLGPMGGFEDMPSKCDIEIDDVARAIYPSVSGSSDLVPTQIAKGETYTVEYEAVLPTILDGNNVWAAALLIDRATGEIVQAGKATQIEGLTGIQQVRNDVETGIETIYDIQGRRINSASGLIVRNGRISFQR